MAEFEELKVTVKVTNSEETKKSLEAIKTGFRDMMTGEHAEGFKSIGRQVHDLENVMKNLTTSLGSGDAFKAISSFTGSLGKGGAVGLAIAGIAELINATIQFASNQARGLATLADNARKLRIHPAQLQAEIEVMRQATPEIAEHQAVEILTHLHQKMVEIGVNGLPEARERLLQFEQDPEVRATKMRILNQMIIAPQAEQLNLLIKGADEIIETYAKQGREPVGQLKAREFIRELTGSEDLLRVKDKFAQVSEDDKALMDQMVSTSKEWLKLTAGMHTDFESITRLIGVQLMEDPVFGGMVRFGAAALDVYRNILEQQLSDKLEGRPAPYEQAPPISIENILSAIILGLGRTLFKRSSERATPEAVPQHLLGGGFDKLSDETGDLVSNFRRLNALLSGEEKPILRLPIHNQPMGGSSGESNPLNLAPDTNQPGGGAATEARQPLYRPWQQGDPTGRTYTTKKGTFNYPILSAVATPLPTLSGGTYSGVSQGRGVATWFGYDPMRGWGEDPDDPKGSNRLRVPERYQGISLSTGTSGALGTSGQTLGQQAYVTDPSTGLTAVRQQTDVGPGVRTQKLVDIAAAVSAREGLTKKQFETQQELVEKGILAPWEVKQAGFGTYGRPGIDGKDIDAPQVKGVEPTVTTQNIRELDTGKLIDPRLVGGQRGTTSGGVDITYGGGSGAFDVGGLYDEGRLRGELGGSPTPSLLQGRQRGPTAEPFTMLAADAPQEGRDIGQRLDRSPIYTLMDTGDLDRGLANEHEVDASGNLDVNVKAPAGTEVKANGDGMFKGNVSLQRQMDLPQAM
jgi:hypothetical protein